MALVFNSGTDRQVTFTKFFTSLYCSVAGGGTSPDRECTWPMETMVPFDLGPFISAYVNDSTKDYVPIAAYSEDHDYKYGIRFVRQNDLVYIYTANKSGGTYSNRQNFHTFNIASPPSSLIVFFVYYNHPSSEASYAFLIKDYACLEVDLQVNTWTESGVTKKSLMYAGEASDVSPATIIPVSNSITPPYQPSMLATHEEWFAYYPPSVLRQNVGQGGYNGFYDFAAGAFDSYDISELMSADGEPPVPPTPPPTPSDDPNDEGDPSDEDGGDGDHDQTYDPIPLPTKPTQGAATAGFITLYKLHQGIMSQFASDCFASNLWEALKLFFSDPMDFLVGVNLLPFEPTGGSSWKPRFGNISFAHAYPTVANQYVDIDCGSINITKYWGSCFDFEPYTKIQIWLPYIGYKDLPVDEIMGMTVSVKYRCDCLTGDCVAFVFTGVVGQTGPQVERIIAQFYGNCAVRVPFSSVSYDSAISNSIALIGAAASAGIAAGAGVAEAAGKAGGEISGLEAAGRELATNTSSVGMVQGMKPNIHKGGAAGASTGYMSVQVPYLIRRIPRQNLPSDYMKLKGYPSNIGGKLSDFTGLAIVDDIQLNDIPAMEDERKEIIQWLRGGVLI